MENIRKPHGFASERLLVLPEYLHNELKEADLTRHLFVSDIGCFPRAQYHYRARPDGCDSHIVFFCADGEGWIELGDSRSVTLTRHQLFVIPACTPHRYGASSDNPWSIYWVHLQGSHAADLIALFSLESSPVQLPVNVFTQFVDAFDQLYELLVNKTYSLAAHVYAAQTMRYLLSSVGIRADRSAQDKKREGYLEHAIQYLTEHLTESVKLADLAQYIGLSKQHLIYLFNRETGVPPIEYFLRMKMQRAGQLLDLTDLSVKEIAISVGLSDPYYFSRLFKQMMGLSPTEYRRIPKG